MNRGRRYREWVALRGMLGDFSEGGKVGRKTLGTPGWTAGERGEAMAGARMATLEPQELDRQRDALSHGWREQVVATVRVLAEGDEGEGRMYREG